MSTEPTPSSSRTPDASDDASAQDNVHTAATATAASCADATPNADVAVESDQNNVVHELNLRDERLRPLIGLELPFYATNVERVLETIGGLENLQQTHEMKSQFLPVKLRPNEPSCKPLFADLAKTQTILLRVRRKRKHASSPGASATSPGTVDTSNSNSIDAEIVGLVREKYVCEGMADFQYFTSRTFYPDASTPSPPSVGADVASNISSSSATQQALQASLRPYLRVSHERELELIPEVFSKVDLPLKYEFRQRSGYQPTESAKKSASTMTYLNFHGDADAPAEPKPEMPVVRRRPVGAHDAVDDHVLEILQAKLAQKPVWLRPALFVGLDVLERRAARRLLRKLCYVFVDGPWRGSWIRMGYDPRKTPDAAKYQVLELRNNRELVHAKVTHPSRKRTKKFSGINPKGPRIVKVTQTSENENAQASKRRRKERFMLSETRRAFLADAGSASASTSIVPDALDGHDSDSDDALDSTATATATGTKASERLYEIFGVPLTSANVLFQLDEVDDDEVRAWTAQFALQDAPTLLGGWYSTHMFLPLREIIRYRIAALVGRSKADLDARRKRIDALKKQALADYADQLAHGDKTPAKTSRSSADAVASDGDAATARVRAEDAEQAAFEESLAHAHAAASRVPSAPLVSESTTPAAAATAEKVTGSRGASGADGMNDEEDEDGDEDLEMDDDDATRKERHQRSRNGSDEEEEDEDDEEEDDDGDTRGDSGASAAAPTTATNGGTPPLAEARGEHSSSASTIARAAHDDAGGEALEYSF